MTSPPSPASRGTVLISGASIAGPALAYWLCRGGYDVTVVEKAGAPREGGYPIDVRGPAVDVVRRMGVLPRLREASVAMSRFTFLAADGHEVASLGASAARDGQDLEVARGELTAALHAAVPGDVEFLFADAIATLEQDEDGVDVTFRSGQQRRFDVVIGADGMHSHTRQLVLGPEEQFHRHLGFTFAVFTMPNLLGLSRELMVWNTPGRAAALYATGGAEDDLHAFLNFHGAAPSLEVLRDLEAQRELVSAVYAGAGWEVPTILQAMRGADDVFFDTVGQIRMPRWSRGRVALVGDAAYAPSLLTGQGTSLALVGAYMLADALARESDHEAAFRAYERDTRDFVTQNQAIVDNDGSSFFPLTADALARRNAALHGRDTMPPAAGRAAYSALTLPPEVSAVGSRD